MVEDENYMTKVYGKASYQNKRTTVKDPYLHYQNVPKPKPDRPAGAPDMSSKLQDLSEGLKILSLESLIYGQIVIFEIYTEPFHMFNIHLLDEC